MALGKHPSLQAELTSWCKDVGIHETHAVMLFNVPADTEVAVIEDVMQAVASPRKNLCKRHKRRTYLTYYAGVV